MGSLVKETALADGVASNRPVAAIKSLPFMERLRVRRIVPVNPVILYARPFG
jgi:hypothetical protein